MRERKGDSAQSGKPETNGEFDFQAGLNIFKKDEVLAKVATETEEDAAAHKYKKDDFFDTLSCDLVERMEGRNSRMTAAQERVLNQDTFGAIALQSNNYRRNYNRGYNPNNTGGSGRTGGGGGRGYGRGRGGGRGGGRGRGYNNYKAAEKA